MIGNSSNLEKQIVVSSGHVRKTMQPTLKKMMAMTVINDNGSAQSDARKQIWFVGIGFLILVVASSIY